MHACADAAGPDETCGASLWLDALPGPLFSAARADSDALSSLPPNFWVPASVLHGCEAPSALFEQVTAALVARCGGCAPSTAGAEVWCQVYRTPGAGLPFHWDKDEARLAKQQEWSHPARSFVVYLNSAAECAPPRLGATHVLCQRFDAGAGEARPATPRAGCLCWPTSNAAFSFDGRLSHGVLDSDSPVIRRALLVNLWDEQPLSVERIRAAEFSRSGLAPPLEVPGPTNDAATAVSLPLLSLSAAAHCRADAVEPPTVEALARDAGFSGATCVLLRHPDCVIWQLSVDGRTAAALVSDEQAAAAAEADEEEEEAEEEAEQG